MRPDGIGSPGSGEHMNFDYLIGGIVTLGLLVYLTYVLLRPERF